MKNNLWGVICLTLAASIWGSMYVVSKYVLEFVPPFTLLWLRYVTGGLVLLIFMVFSRKYKVIGKDLLLMIWIGFIGYFVSVGSQFLGTKLADAHTGALITASSPVFTFLFAYLLLHESITMRKMLSLILSMAGMVTVIGFSQTGENSLLGSLFLVIAAITWALLSIYVKKASARYSSLTITTYALLFAVVFTSPAAAWEIHSHTVLLFANPLVWLGTLYIGIVSTAVAFLLWNKGLESMDAGLGSLFLCFQPIVGSLLGWLWLDEGLTVQFFIGAALILGGLIVASFPEKQKNNYCLRYLR